MVETAKIACEVVWPNQFPYIRLKLIVDKIENIFSGF